MKRSKLEEIFVKVTPKEVDSLLRNDRFIDICGSLSYENTVRSKLVNGETGYMVCFFGETFARRVRFILEKRRINMAKKKDVSEIKVKLDSKDLVKDLQKFDKNLKKIDKQIQVLEIRVKGLERWRAKGY